MTRAACAEAVAALGYPLFVKPCPRRVEPRHQQGARRERAEAAIEAGPNVRSQGARRGGRSSAREMECGVLTSLTPGAPPDVSVVAEIVMHSSPGVL